ncbi:Der1-like protein [Tilletiopsis washingtonensis]|uniref:Derlin n=1 Tax=Tilletiopsis washingtonensis TaxID=58919 RepID=A0A316Z7J7_9BASI|nr:Der1-like protein [Tilletiopsis washingtonensis]PWN96143.1 Der1-like protein [Tilletiopsis washingtonensis]
MDLDGLPPITRLWAGSALALAVAEHVALVSPYQLFFSPRLVFARAQLHRLATCFLYFGPLGVDFLFHLFFFLRYSRMLEESHFAGRRADFVWLLLVASAALLALAPLATLPFLGSPLAFVLVYVWSRWNRHVRLSLFGVLVISAPYLPWSLVAFSWLINGSPKAAVGDILGVAIGHLYYFLVDVWPREVRSGGRNWLATPTLFARLIDGPRRDD